MNPEECLHCQSERSTCTYLSACPSTVVKDSRVMFRVCHRTGASNSESMVHDSVVAQRKEEHVACSHTCPHFQSHKVLNMRAQKHIKPDEADVGRPIKIIVKHR